MGAAVRDSQRLGIFVVTLIVCGWSSHAFAVATGTMTPSTIDTGFAAINMDTPGGVGTLTGTESVDLTERSCTGGMGTFTVTPNNNINLNAGAVMVSVTYRPSAVGDRSCIWDIKDKTSQAVVGSFTVRGSTPPVLTVTPIGAFGSVRWSDGARFPTSFAQFRVENTGYHTLSISSASVAGADFALTGGPATAALTHNSTVTYTVTFNPQTAGTKTGSLNFTANVATTPTPLSGVGTNATIAVSPTPTINIGDVQAGQSNVANVTATNGGANPAGPLYVSNSTISGGNGWFRFSACGAATCNLNATIASGAPQSFGIICAPPAAAPNGTMQTATVTLGNDSDNQNNNTTQVACRAVTSVIGLAPSSSVDFGGVLLGATSAPTTITVTNTGGAPYGPFFFEAGVGFAATCVTGCVPVGCGAVGNQCTLPMAAQMTVSVTFSPTAETGYGAGLVLNRGSANASLSLAGRGIDKHIALTDAVVAPDTFRCPGDKATLVPLTVDNSGEADLSITSFNVSGEPVWSLAETLPIIVPGCTYPCTGPGTRDVMVRFAPQAIGKAVTGQLTLISDASPVADQMKNVRLDGNGKERLVDMLPGVVPFPVTGAGVPAKLSAGDEVLTVTNTDAEPFMIREIVVSGDNSKIFSVRNLDGSEVKNVMIGVGETKEFDVIFAPDEVGEFSATINLFIDQDCEPQRSNEVVGRAVFVDAHGSSLFGCACRTGHGGSGVLIVFAILFVRRRRRR